MARARAYLEAGASVGFVPGAASEDIAGLVDGLGRNMLTVISVPGVSPPARELQELVSTGPFTQRVALPALHDAAQALLAGGELPKGSRALN